MSNPLPVPSDFLEGAAPVVSRDEASHIAVLRRGAASAGATAPSVADAADAATAAPVGGDAAGDGDGEPYYWETNATDSVPPPLPVVLVHHVHYFFSRAWSTAEYIGDFFSELFGLYNSRYEWALELERRHQEEAEEAELLEERKKRWAEMRAAGAKGPVPVRVGAPTAAVASANPEANALLAKDEAEASPEAAAGTGV